jgi:periplasmic protein TonB
VRALAPPIVLATIAETPEEQPPPEAPLLNTTAVLSVPDPIWIPDDFRFDEQPLIVKKSEGGEARIGPAVIERAAPMRVLPKLRAMEKPSYPPTEVRAGNQGTTGIEVCVDARGRVTSTSLKQSSGHVRLDEAALKWVRDARFTPGSVDGSPQAMCGHNVFYEWKLENGRT